jgi:hypothetical protein
MVAGWPEAGLGPGDRRAAVTSVRRATAQASGKMIAMRARIPSVPRQGSGVKSRRRCAADASSVRSRRVATTESII